MLRALHSTTLLPRPCRSQPNKKARGNCGQPRELWTDVPVHATAPSACAMRGGEADEEKKKKKKIVACGRSTRGQRAGDAGRDRGPAAGGERGSRDARLKRGVTQKLSQELGATPKT